MSNALSGAFLSASGKKLKEGLEGLHSLLENKEQNEKKDNAALKKLAAGLVKSKLVGHKDKRIRLLCACCLADIIRVLAPQHPFSDAQLKVAFDLFLSELKHLNDTGERSLRQYLLRRLAEVKAFVLLLDDEDQTGALFEILFGYPSDVDHEDVPFILAIMVACIEEMDEPNPHMLMYLLDALCADPETFNAACGREIVVRCKVQLEDSITQLLLNVIQDHLGLENPLQDEDCWKWEVEYHHVIARIHSIAPGMLVHVLPKVGDELQSPNVELRRAAVSCLCCIFGNECSSAATSYRTLFGMLVERANDQNVDIRLEIVSAMPAMFERTDEPDILAEALEKRLRDHNEDVRQQAVISACAVGRSAPEKVTAELMASVGLRIRDKSHKIMVTAVTELSELYHALVCQWGIQWSDESAVEKFDWIASEVLVGYLQPDYVLRSAVDEVLDTVMLPVGGDLEDRCQHLLEVYLNLTEDGQKALLNMIKDKLRFRSDLLKWIDTKGSSKMDAVTFASENPEVVASYKSVLKYFPGHEDEGAAVRALDSMSRDLIEALRVLVTEAEYSECRESKNYACSLLGKSKPVKNKDREQLSFHQAIIRKASLTVMPKEFFPVFVEHIEKPVDEEDKESIILFISELAKEFRESIAAQSDQLWRMTESRDQNTVEFALRLIASAAPCMKATRKHCASLLTHCIGEKPSLAPHASACLTGLLGAKSPELRKAIKECVGYLHDEQEQPKQRLCALKSLSQFASARPQEFCACRDEVLDWVFAWSLDEDKLVGSKVESRFGFIDLSAMIFASVVELAAEAVAHQEEANRAQEVLDMLFATLQRNPKDVPSYSVNEWGIIRSACYAAVLTLATNKRIDRLVSTENFLQLAAVIDEPSVHARKAFVTALSSGIQRLKLSVRYISLLVLFDGEANRDLRAEAKKCLIGIIHQRRAILANTNLPNDKRVVLLPEYALFFVVHLLGHITALKADAPRFVKTTQYLRFFLDPLTHQTQNQSFLLRILDEIKSSKDILSDKNALGVSVVSEIASLLVMEKLKGKRWQPYNVAIPAPKTLFRAKKVSKAVKSLLPIGFRLPKASERVGEDDGKTERSVPSKRPRSKEANAKAISKRQKRADDDVAEPPEPARRSTRRGAVSSAAKIRKTLATEQNDDPMDTESGEEEQQPQRRRAPEKVKPKEDEEEEEPSVLTSRNTRGRRARRRA